MSPKVLSILNNATMFLSPEEMAELCEVLVKQVGKPAKEKKRASKPDPLEGWTVETVTERLLQTYFKKGSRIKTTG